MCLSFDYFGNLGNVVASHQHDNVSCDNVQVALLRTGVGGLNQFCLLPIKSDSAKMACFPIPRECLGDKHEHLKPSLTIPCLASELTGILTPEAYVRPPYGEQPQYRSLGGGGGGGAEAADGSQLCIAPATCVTNDDGSKLFVFRTKELVPTEEELEHAVKNGMYVSREDFLNQMKRAAWTAFAAACKENDVHMPALFECGGKDEFGDHIVDEMAKMAFCEAFYPSLVPGCDSAFAIPKIDDQGNAVMDTAFSVHLAYDAMPNQVWLPSLHHNDVAAMKKDQTTVKVDESYMVWANFAASMCIGSGCFAGACKKEEEVVVVLEPPNAFYPTFDPEMSYERFEEEGDYGPSYRSLPPSSAWSGPDPDELIHYTEWNARCRGFQFAQSVRMRQKLEKAMLVEKEEMENWESLFHMLRLQNLISTDVPTQAVCGRLVYGEERPVDGSGHTEKMRLALMKHVEESKKRPAEATTANQQEGDEAKRAKTE